MILPAYNPRGGPRLLQRHDLLSVTGQRIISLLIYPRTHMLWAPSFPIDVEPGWRWRITYYREFNS